MPDFDEYTLAKLAREMAMNVRKPSDVFADFSIDETEYYEIERSTFYKRAFEQFALEWNSALSATERVKVISASYLEQVLPVIAAKALSREENLGAATDVAKFLARNAGIGEGKDAGSPVGERFVITINLGADVEGKPVIEKYDKSIEIDANDVGPGTGVQTLAQIQANSAQILPNGAQIPANSAQILSNSEQNSANSPTSFFDGIDQ